MSTLTNATGTPVVSVKDNRGRAIRALNWNHEDSAASLRLMVSHTLLNDADRTAEHRDPRLFATWTADNTATANLSTLSSLAGQVLRRESTDSGEQIALFDAAGRTVWVRDGRGTVQTVAYDELGRPESGSEQLSGSDEIRVSWRSDYGDAGQASDGSQDDNLRGVVVAQYDGGGMLAANAVALSGALLSQAQRFLVSADDLPDWPEDEADRDALLEAETYSTVVTADARGATLTCTDAAGHIQQWRYNVSGSICYQDVTPAGGVTQTLLENVAWSAAGQVLTESAGNGVTTTWSYDQQNQWLATITAQRSDNTTLQALSYGYDNVGNVTSVSDNSVAVGYYRNQATNGIREFTYDALYQLLSASGRENAANTVMPYGSLPALLPPDSSQYSGYTRSYTYDDSGNLQTLKHIGAGSYTRTMTTESTSNRSVQQNDGGPQTPDEVAGWFDSNGNLQKLQASKSSTDGLIWDGSNNLQSVTLLSRSSGSNDEEIYQYRGSQRVRKQTRTLVNSDTQLWDVSEVRYLPGLELRKSWQETAGSSASPSLSEELHVITGQAGRAGIRVLHWEAGKPDDIANDQVRWSVDDNIGSLTLELDVDGKVISREEYYPFGGTAVWSARSEVEAEYKTVRYSGKERDSTGLYYYGYRYYAPWLCRWVSADPAREVDGLNLFRMVRNNPVTLQDSNGLMPGLIPPPPGPPGPPPPAFGMPSTSRGATAASGPQFEPKLMAQPVMPDKETVPLQSIETYVDLDKLKDTIKDTFKIVRPDFKGETVTDEELNSYENEARQHRKQETIPYEPTAPGHPAAWASPVRNTFYLSNESPDYSYGQSIDKEKVQSTIVHESLHLSSHQHEGFQISEGEPASANLKYDEFITDYFAEQVYKKLYPDAEYKTGYYTLASRGRGYGPAGLNLAKFMIDSGFITEEELRKAFFDTGIVPKMGSNLEWEWKKFAQEPPGTYKVALIKLQEAVRKDRGQ